MKKGKTYFGYSSDFIKVMIFTSSLMVIVISTSYWYVQSLIAEEDARLEQEAKIVKLDTDLDKVAKINVKDLELIKPKNVDKESEKVEFHVKAKKDTKFASNYDVYLKEINMSNNLYSKYFKWELLKNNKIIKKGDFSKISVINADSIIPDKNSTINTTTADIKLTPISLPLPRSSDKEDELIFRYWLENDPHKNQIALTKGNFSAKLYIDAYQVSNKSKETK